MTKEKTKNPKSKEQPPKTRQLKSAGYKSFRLQKKVKHPINQRVPLGGFQIFRELLKTLRRHWWAFLGISLIYGVLNLLLVQGLGGFDVQSARQNLQSVFDGGPNAFGNAIGVFTEFFSGSRSLNNDVAGVYQFILLIIMSLALIWMFRHAQDGEKLRVRDGLYRGMTSLIPFLLVYLVIGLQLLPLVLGTYLFAIVGPGAYSVNGAEIIAWSITLFLLAILSLYMLVSSIFALYIVSLPAVTPMTALRSARKLVKYRRLLIVRRFLVLPVILAVLMLVLMVPPILFAPPVAVVTFFIVSMLLLPLGHGFMFGLYKELIDEAK
ncbi:MAG TPA: hypothetical protein VF733_03525 [Candidatus Saccharimonadales bacterium]